MPAYNEPISEVSLALLSWSASKALCARNVSSALKLSYHQQTELLTRLIRANLPLFLQPRGLFLLLPLQVVGAKVVTNARSPGARCYGFVTMASSEEATKCINHLHRTELHGKMISVEKVGGSSHVAGCWNERWNFNACVLLFKKKKKNKKNASC